MKLFARIATALVFLFAGAANAAVTQTQLGTGNGTTSFTITTGAAAPTGSLVVVVVSVLTNATAVTSVADSAGNCTGAYTALDNATTVSRPTVAVFYCKNTATLLPSGGIITVTLPAAAQGAATAFALSGMDTTAPADISAKQVNGTASTTATTTSTGTLGAAYEIVVGALGLNGTTTNFAPGAGWVSIGGVSSTNGSAYAATVVACTTASVSFTPSWNTGRSYMSDVVSFKFAAADTQCNSKVAAYDVLANGAPASASASKVNAYAVLQNAMAASKTLAYSVMTAVSENASKLNTYFVMLNVMASSKVNAYDVLRFGGLNQQNASKLNTYAVLQYSSSASKLNSYFVLKPKLPGGFLFHSFP